MSLRQYLAAPLCAATLALGAAVGVGPGVAHAAGTGYGPPTAVVMLAPGFAQVFTARPLHPAGGSFTLHDQGWVLKFSLGRGILSQPAQLAVTKGKATVVDHHKPRVLVHFKVLFSLAVLLKQGTRDIRLTRPMTFTIFNAKIVPHSVVLVWNAPLGRFVRDHHASIHGHTATITLHRGQSISIVAP